ncbi:nitroreductase family protein [Ferruginibacter paludis]|uniref:nitroreductase family protein n=1 Tax=Ferruginibacter paludis TaxID=1310417 RepID=UPI0025B5DE05|nr:nitroreductase family protein [Ferruginibacter paludis]MDN3656144.1 nitroreductase family protein [Ferruginibacter paludis]
MHTIKKAITKYPVLDIIKKRWSPRSFSDKAISETDVKTIIEAASWSFSALNEQPWRYVAAFRGTSLFDSFFDLLNAGNKNWNNNTSVLVLSVLSNIYSNDGTVNTYAMHDTGAANMLLTLQANSMGIYTHLMEGFSKEHAQKLLNQGDEIKPVVMIALGYPDVAEKLDEPFKTRELSPRSRKDINEILLEPQLP